MKPDGTDETMVLKAPKELELAPLDEFLLAWSPDGRKIVWTVKYDGYTGSKTYVMNVDGSGLTAIHDELATATSLDWQPVGR